MIDPERALDAVGQLPDSEIEIADAALQFARIDRPEADARSVQLHLTDLARKAADLGSTTEPDDPFAQADALATLLAGECGYLGDRDTYDDLGNANLITVFERRRGLPVALGVLWLHTARAAGWSACGLDFPGHFLLGVQAGGGQAVLDVFAGGVRLAPSDLRDLVRSFEGAAAELRPELLRPMSTRAVLLRLQNNIKLRRLRGGDLYGAQTCNEDMLRIAPEEATLWRDAALLNARADEVRAALRCWERFLALVPTGKAAEQARAAIGELRSRLH